jgi:protein TonB
VRAGEWSCPWPNEAELEQIDEATVTIRAFVSEQGVATRVEVVADPGHGFGREARRCAMHERYVPALDRDGRPIASITKPIRVRFSR